MNYKDLKLAIYLDEAGDTPQEACKTITDLGISNIVLRTAWTKEISKMPDESIGQLRDIIQEHSLKPILLYTTIGDGPVKNILEQFENVKRALLIAEALGCGLLRISLGKATKSPDILTIVNHWMQIISAECLSANVKPIFNLDMGACITQPAEISQILNAHRRWGIIYDPADVIGTRNLHPFSKYWSLLKSRVAAIDLHDHKIGIGPKPLGYGDGQLDLTVNDAILSKFSGWYCIKPGLGRKFGQLVGKPAIAKFDTEMLQTMLDRMDLPKN